MNSKHVSDDIITNLPSSIIETILCLVPVRDAVRTSILSNKWRYNWVKIPKLVFDEKDMFNEATDEQCTTESSIDEMERFRLARETKMRKTFSALQQVMLTYQGPIVEFSLSMDLDRVLTYVEINQIITHLATQDTLKKFSLDFPYDIYTYDCYYSLPSSVFSWNHLTDLYLHGCDLDFEPTFSGCSSLTSLYLDNFLECENLIGYSKDDYAVVKLFECLPMIEYFSISIGVIQWFFNSAIPRELPKTLIHLKYFYLSEMTFHNGYEMPFIFLLIRSSPNLEKIKLQILGVDDDDAVRMEDYSDICLEHLNELEIRDFFNSKNELEFVKLILTKSPVLKKVNIFLDYEVTYDDEIVLLTTLLRSPRQSREVEISVEL